MYVLKQTTNMFTNENSYSYGYALYSTDGSYVSYGFSKNGRNKTVGLNLYDGKSNRRLINITDDRNVDEEEMNSIFRKFVDFVEDELVNLTDFKTSKQIQAEQASADPSDGDQTGSGDSDDSDSDSDSDSGSDSDE